jgi:hypothetical protein
MPSANFIPVNKKAVYHFLKNAFKLPEHTKRRFFTHIVTRHDKEYYSVIISTYDDNGVDGITSAQDLYGRHVVGGFVFSFKDCSIYEPEYYVQLVMENFGLSLLSKYNMWVPNDVHGNLGMEGDYKYFVDYILQLEVKYKSNPRYTGALILNNKIKDILGVER